MSTATQIYAFTVRYGETEREPQYVHVSVDETSAAFTDTVEMFCEEIAQDCDASADQLSDCGGDDYAMSGIEHADAISGDIGMSESLRATTGADTARADIAFGIAQAVRSNAAYGYGVNLGNEIYAYYEIAPVDFAAYCTEYTQHGYCDYGCESRTRFVTD